MPDSKLGPFTTRQWAIGAGGGLLAFVGYRWWQARRAASAAAASTATTGGTTIPPGTAGAGSGLPQTLSAWLQQAFSFGGISTLNAWTNWISGNCVDQAGYNGLVAAITNLGLPPGVSQFPPLGVCAGAGSGSGSSGGSGSGGSGGSGGPPPPGGEIVPTGGDSLSLPPGSTPAAAPGPNVYPPAGDVFGIGPAFGPSPTGYNIPSPGPYGSPGWSQFVANANAAAQDANAAAPESQWAVAAGLPPPGSPPIKG